MNRSNCIKKIAAIKEIIILHKESIRKAALPMTVVAALLFFWIGGGDEEEVIEQTDRPVSELVSEQTDVSNASGDEIIAETIDIYVDIGGCVHKPGVYKIKDGTRLFEVIEKAGGLTDDADTNTINQAEQVHDGQKIIIGSVVSNGNETSTITESYSKDGKININYADSETLQEIPGVGPSTAKKIIDYRENTGRFKEIEDIKNVSGIGEKTFENLKEYITV